MLWSVGVCGCLLFVVVYGSSLLFVGVGCYLLAVVVVLLLVCCVCCVFVACCC